jgi:CubicO group peptidase (beta-lactamase class C family)
LKEIGEIFAKNRRAGLFTHGYVAFGSLEDERPSYVHQELPDGRDVFDLASLTKALVTTVLCFHLKNKGELDFSRTLEEWLGKDKVSDLAPELRQLTVLSLLRHDSGLPAWRNFWINHLGVDSPDRTADLRRGRHLMVEVLNRSALPLKPSLGQVYSDVGFILLGLCLERATGENEMMLFDGIRPKNLLLGYGPSLDISSRAVPTAECKLRRKLLQGEVHDENCASVGGVSGHAGLFGTGEALARYLHLLAQSPAGKQLLEENARARILPVQTPPNEALLGWRQGADPSSLPFGNGSAMGHMGFTGVAFWVCPDSGHYAILLTNRVISGRLNPGIAAMRRAVFTALETLRR